MTEKIKIYTSGGVRYVTPKELARDCGGVIFASTGEPVEKPMCRTCAAYVPVDAVLGQCRFYPTPETKDPKDWCFQWTRRTEPHE